MDEPAARPLPARGWPRPGKLLVVACVAWAGIGAAVLFAGLPREAWLLAGSLLAVAGVVDLVLLRGWRSPEVTRELPDTLAIGIEREVTLVLETGAQAGHVRVFDLYPGGWEAQGLPQSLALARHTKSSVRYRLRPTARGRFVFPGVQLLVRSPLRLWHQSRVVGAVRDVEVFPNFAPLTRFALLSAEQATNLIGAHVRRRRGEGTDFKQLREYRVGDSLRQIDWKATARVRKPISREYQDERNQQVVVMLDTGRRMLARDGLRGHFDQSLDASLLVAYLALRQGDAVGLHASGGEQRWVPPVHGAGAIQALLKGSFDLQPKAVATDYLAAANELVRLQRRRALVFWVTNVRDEDGDDLMAAVSMLQRRHLVVVASLREAVLDQVLETTGETLADALRIGAAARYVEDRRLAHERLRRHRVAVLDVTSDQLPAALVQQYLSVKRAGLL